MNTNKNAKPVWPLVILLAAGLVTRLFAMNIDLMYENDLHTFQAWASILYTNGLPGFYGKGFTDYPPVYMYVMYVLGGLRELFGFETLSPGYNLLTKMPAVLCDLALGFGLYKLAAGKLSLKAAVLLTAAWVFNPAVILDSSVWGQVDSFYTLTLFVALDLLRRQKFLFAYLAYGIAVLTKPQSLFVGPVFLYGAFAWLKDQSFSFASWKKFAGRLVAAGGFMLLLSLPFTEGFDFMPIIGQYIGTLDSYAYASINAYNFFALVGGNWRLLNETFLALPYSLWGFVFLLLIVAGSVFYLHKKGNIWYAAAALNILVFMFSIKMHERYMFPALFFLLIAYITSTSEKKVAEMNRVEVEIVQPFYDSRLLFLYVAFSFTFFMNCTDVLRMLAAGNSLAVIENSLPVFSFINVILAGYTVYIALKAPVSGKRKNGTNVNFWEQEHDIDTDSQEHAMIRSDCAKHSAENHMRVPIHSATDHMRVPGTSLPPVMSRRDIILLLALITLYTFIAFFRLGNTQSPQTTWQPQEGGYAMVDFGEEVFIDRVQFMQGARHDKPFVMYASADGVNWTFTHNIEEASVFAWTSVPVKTVARYFEFIPHAFDEFMLQEAAFFGADGELIPVGYVTGGAEKLFDEQNLVPDRPDYMTETYFDEIYHARTGYEFANGLWPYENTHPPLGKDLIALSIKIFGMTPFGWRFPGTLFGVLMVPLLYAFARNIFRSNNWALFTSAVFTFDFMHFAQTRLATIDTYVTFFVIFMYFFMFKYTKKRSLITLLACGVCMGLAIASKWQGIYGAVGLPVLFLPEWLKILKESKRDAFATAGWCVLFFIVIPAFIYALSYIPFAVSCGAKDFPGFIGTVIENQETMWSYHSNLVSEHAFSSTWWQWPLMTRPIYYFSGEVTKEIRQGISSFGNPAVWWTGIVAAIYAIRHFVKTKDSTLLFLLTAYAAQYIPWMLVPRTTYIYHYFPSVPFVVILISYMFRNNFKSFKAPLIYACIAIFLFVLFFPVLSGIPINKWYVENLLRWLPTWVLI